MRVLVLAGTGDGRAVAAALRDAGHEVVESVAGVTASARRRDGVRTGGFGGAAGLAAWLVEHHVDAVVNATHPFAARMSANAAVACRQVGVPLARWARPSWRGRPDAAGWAWVPDHATAARVAAGQGRVFLTVGRQELTAYLALPDVVARVTEPGPGWVTPAGWQLLVARGPFAVVDETALMREHGVRVLVTKDAGGSATAAKLDAAGALGVRVVAVARPGASAGVPELGDLDAVLAWVGRLNVAPGPVRPRHPPR